MAAEALLEGAAGVLHRLPRVSALPAWAAEAIEAVAVVEAGVEVASPAPEEAAAAAVSGADVEVVEVVAAAPAVLPRESSPPALLRGLISV